MSLSEGLRDQIGVFAERPPRTRTCLKGKLVYRDGLQAPGDTLSLDCTIRDISDGGAKIALTTQQSLPIDLYLIVIKQSIAYHARIAWRIFPMRGLQFLKTYPLQGELRNELTFLRRLWGDLYPRSGILDASGMWQRDEF